MNDPYRILVVDDDANIVQIIATALRQAGYDVATADNGEDACQAAESLRPISSSWM